jgi:hypothetical protein
VCFMVKEIRVENTITIKAFIVIDSNHLPLFIYILLTELEKAAIGTSGACRHFFRIEDISVQKPKHVLRLQLVLVI